MDSTPGTTVQANTARMSPLVSRRMANVIRGPTAAPRVSMLRWKPKALPMYLRSVELAIMASRGLPRTPLPTRSRKIRSRAGCHV